MHVLRQAFYRGPGCPEIPSCGSGVRVSEVGVGLERGNVLARTHCPLSTEQAPTPALE